MILKILRLTLLLFIFTFTNCTDKIDETALRIDAEQMASLQCAARQLRNERFEAANQIRLKEENMLQKGEKITPDYLLKNDSIAKDLTKRTGDLAAKINNTLDSCFKNKYKTIDQRLRFDKAVEEILAIKCH